MPGSTYTFYNPNPDIPIAGDWDSDGDDTPAMFRPPFFFFFRHTLT